MKVVNPSVIDLTNSGIYFWHDIETAARVCYHSEDSSCMSDQESKAWVEERIIKSGHNRALEFGTVYLSIPWWRIKTILFYKFNHWSRMEKWGVVTTNYRVIHENHRECDLSYVCRTKDHAVRRMLMWSISRGIADEFRTHCSISSLMQSTRYCKLNGKRFDNNVSFVSPTGNQFDVEPLSNIWRSQEEDYAVLLRLGYTAEQARDVLPFGVRTILIQCAFEDDWKQFFKLRAERTEHNRPHPDAEYIASKARKLLFGR